VADASTLARWRHAARSYVLALRASRRYGRSIKLHRAGRLPEALQVARGGLALLSTPGVLRQEGPEGSGIVCLTIEVEWLAGQLGELGARSADVRDAVVFLRSLPEATGGKVGELRSVWLPYLEARLAGSTQVV
jgi:hypothetical protein